jgi:hypothetical protein
VTQQEADALYSRRRARKGEEVGGAEESEAKHVDKEAIELVAELEEVVVGAWRQQEERRLSTTERAVLAALAAHVLKFSAARRALAAHRGAEGEKAHKSSGDGSSSSCKAGGEVVKEVSSLLAFALRTLLSPSGGGGGKGGKHKRDARAGLIEECCAYFVESVCSCLGRLKPALKEEAFALLLALLLAPNVHLGEEWRLQSLKQLLLNSSRDNIAQVSKTLLSELAQHTARAGAIVSDDSVLLRRVHSTMSLLHCRYARAWLCPPACASAVALLRVGDWGSWVRDLHT